MASFKTFIFVLALFAVALAVEEVREKKGIATGLLGYGGYYGGLGRSVLPYGYGGLGYGLGYGNLGYHGLGGYGVYNHGLGGHYYY